MIAQIKLTMTRGTTSGTSTLDISAENIRNSDEFDAVVGVIAKSQLYKGIMEQLMAQRATVTHTEIRVFKET